MHLQFRIPKVSSWFQATDIRLMSIRSSGSLVLFLPMFEYQAEPWYICGTWVTFKCSSYKQFDCLTYVIINSFFHRNRMMSTVITLSHGECMKMLHRREVYATRSISLGLIEDESSEGMFFHLWCRLEDL